MDNINMYQGKQKHLMLFKYVGPKIWDFTGGMHFSKSGHCQTPIISKTEVLRATKDNLLLKAAEQIFGW